MVPLFNHLIVLEGHLVFFEVRITATRRILQREVSGGDVRSFDGAPVRADHR
jgi:hypothetical protein